MIRHTVAFKLKHPPGSAPESAFLAAARILSAIPTVRQFECLRQVGKKNAFTFGFSMEFASQPDYDAYNIHPDHVHLWKRAGNPRCWISWSWTTSHMSRREEASPGQPASGLISQRIADLADWRGETLGRMRQLIQQADPDVVEEWKWVSPTKPGTPVWSHDGIICTGETYKDKVKLTFAKGASLKDPACLFNASLDGNARRAIDIAEGETVDATAFKALVRQAVALNQAGKVKPVKRA